MRASSASRSSRVNKPLPLSARSRRRLLFLLCLLAVLAVCLPQAWAEAPGAQRVYLDSDPAAPALDAAVAPLDIYVCDLKGADCMLLVLEGRSLLVDTGSRDQAGKVKAVLDAAGLDGVDAVFNTHPHTDHVGGLLELLKQVPVKQFYTCFAEDASGHRVMQKTALQKVRAAGIPVARLQHGDEIPFGAARIRVLQNAKAGDVNDQSGLLRITYGDCSILLTGDACGRVLGHFAALGGLKSDILKYPHHGLAPVNADFLAGVNPEYAFFTHGHFASHRAQRQLDAAGVRYSFAQWGVIHLQSDGKVWLVQQSLNKQALPWAQQYGYQTRFPQAFAAPAR